MWSFGGKGTASVSRNLPLQRMRMVATHIDWPVGPDADPGAPEIRGPVLALRLLFTRRTVALRQLEGVGTSMLHEPI